MSVDNVSELQAALSNLAQVAAAAAAPFIKNPTSQSKVGVIGAEVNLGIAALPTLSQLFSAIGALFGHAHAAATAVAPATAGQAAVAGSPSNGSPSGTAA